MFARAAQPYRRTRLRLLGAYVAPTVWIGRAVKVSGPRKRIRILDYAVLNDGVHLVVSAAAQSPDASILVGERTLLGEGTKIVAHGTLAIGPDCLLAPRVTVHEARHGMSRVRPMNQQPQTWQSIQIENDVWIGTGAVILGGVVIQRGAVVGANSVVTKSVPPWEVWAGAPAKKISLRTEATR